MPLKLSLRSAGKTDVLIEPQKTTPTKALRIIKAWTAHAKNVLVPYTPEEHCICLLKFI
jgi:hypothetical protein